MWWQLHPREVLCHREEEPGIHTVKHPLGLYVVPDAEWPAKSGHKGTTRGITASPGPRNPHPQKEYEGFQSLPANDGGLLPRPINNLVGDAGVCDVIGGSNAQRLVPGYIPTKTPTGTRKTRKPFRHELPALEASLEPTSNKPTLPGSALPTPEPPVWDDICSPGPERTQLVTEQLSP